MNYTEPYTDCGGLFCDSICSIGPNVPTIQRSFFHRQITFEDPYFEINNIAVADSIDRVVFGYHDINAGDRRVVLQDIGLQTSKIIHERQAGDGPLGTAWVDISTDGTMVLFTYGSKLYVYDGISGIKTMVLEEISTLNGDWDLSIRFQPQFEPKARPDFLYFIQVETSGTNGSGARAAGLWRARTDIKTQGQQIFSAVDVAQLYGEDWTSYSAENGVNGPLVAANNQFLFGTRDYSTGGYSDLWVYQNGQFELITNQGPAGFTFYTISQYIDFSSDGSTVCWLDGVDRSYRTVNRWTGETNRFKNLGLGNDSGGGNFTGGISTNHDGSIFFLQGPSSSNENTALATHNGKVHYPLIIDKALSTPTNNISGAVMNKLSGDMIYYSSNVGNLWMSEFEKYILERPHPGFSNRSIPHTLKEHYNGNPYNKFKIIVGTINDYPPVEWVRFVDLDENGQQAYTLNNTGTNQLYDDGMTYGDEAVDDWFTSNYVWPTAAVYNSEEERTLTMRLVAGNDYYISSIDLYPYYILNEPLSSVTSISEKNLDINLYPTLARENVTIEFDGNEELKIDRILICDQYQRIIKQPLLLSSEPTSHQIDVSKLSAGMHFIRIEANGSTVLKKFIKVE